jgi:hypothetical protein
VFLISYQLSSKHASFAPSSIHPHKIIIAAPLCAIGIFCFGFVMMSTPHAGQAANQSSANRSQSQAGLTAPKTLPRLSLQTNAATDKVTNGPSAANQPAASPQAADSNNQPGGSITSGLPLAPSAPTPAGSIDLKLPL